MFRFERNERRPRGTSHRVTGMVRRTPIRLALVSFAGLSIATLAGAADLRPAPGVRLHAEDGTTVQLADYKGQVVLIDFWASWCPPCKTSFPALDALYRTYRDRGLQVLAVNVDERRKDADAFLATQPHVMPVLFDPKGDAPLAFAIRGMPSSILIDRNGNIRFTHMGYSTQVLDSYRVEVDRLLSER
jgi:thiol-disulfide isomerase/thioredoxin